MIFSVRLKQMIRFCVFSACRCSWIAVYRLMFGPVGATKREQGLDATQKPGLPTHILNLGSKSFDYIETIKSYRKKWYTQNVRWCVSSRLLLLLLLLFLRNHKNCIQHSWHTVRSSYFRAKYFRKVFRCDKYLVNKFRDSRRTSQKVSGVAVGF